MRPIVGLIPLWDDEKESLWMLPGYMDGVRCADGIPVMFPLTEDEEEISRLVDMVDGILFTGGHDVDPNLYDEQAQTDNLATCQLRDRMELKVLEKAMKQDKPVLGICRGIQLINAALGGSLYQDLPTQYQSDTEHHQSPPYDQPVHEVSIVKGSPLYNLLETERLAVNSYHHQAVKVIAHSLCEMARSEDGLIEAVYKPDMKFLWALQWHPEFSFEKDAAQMKIFEAFVATMKECPSP